MDLHQPEQVAAAFMAAASKDTLAALARNHGWRGDDARTSKSDIAQHLALSPAVAEIAKQLGLPDVAVFAQDDGAEAGGDGTPQGAKAEQAQQAKQKQRREPDEKPADDQHDADAQPAEQKAEKAAPKKAKKEQQGEGEQEQQPEPIKPEDRKQQQQPEAKKNSMYEAIKALGFVDVPQAYEIADEVAVHTVTQAKKGIAAAVAEIVKVMQEERAAHAEQQPAEAPEARVEKLVIREGAEPIKLDDHTHPLFDKVTKLVAAGLNVLLVGPAGCGKTTLAHLVSKALQRDFGALHCTAGASESQIIGWLLPTAEHGRFEYVPSEFVRLYEKGNSIFLFDEIDAADPNMLLIINSALANGALHVPQRYSAPHVARGPNAGIIAAANTFGNGADLVYAGRNQLDGATLDRFYVVEMDYDKTLEKKLADEELRTWVWNLRKQATALRLRRVVSTRMLLKGTAAKAAGLSMTELKRDLLAGWTRDELAKVGEAR